MQLNLEWFQLMLTSLLLNPRLNNIRDIKQIVNCLLPFGITFVTMKVKRLTDYWNLTLNIQNLMINRFIIGATHQKVVWNYVFESPSEYESIKSESSLNIDSLTEIKLQLIA